MAEQPIKGTVMSLSSLFDPEDTHKASGRVLETISQHQKQVQQLQSFLNDNTNLINLVKKLPDQLHHDIMVPFGKAAFFPGKLIHTNELMVLLGEGYYAERTSKQTVEILKRRGKELELQIETLNTIIKDLKFEASFFDETATEAAEGIVEIREDYVDEVSNKDETTTAEMNSGEDDFARILSRMDELEKEELESENVEEGEEEEEETSDLSPLMSRISVEPKPGIRTSEVQRENEHSISQRSSQTQTQQDMSKLFKPEDSLALSVSKDAHVKVPTSSVSNTPPMLVEHNKLKESLLPTPVPKNEVSTLASKSSNDNSKRSVSNEVSNVASSSAYDTSKAFTGSIVERTHNVEKVQKGQTPAPSSKPVSRFKLQRK
uniref:unconventional prefoldin RPB5 interactor isoform X2 n=1 Tax=Erigeron canadensis TaxID=72917 RepID=UPI001CB8EC10|nr:unconventional prefoldin RPB5 interactor isoform X2 [Erigeron canadensis]